MVSTIGLVFQLLMLFFIINNFKLIAKNNGHISSPMHACMQYIRAPPTLVCRPGQQL